MKKLNAFIFISCYLLMTKVVFSATITMEGKNYECPVLSFGVYACGSGEKTFFVSSSADLGYIAITKDSGTLTLKPIKKIVEAKRVLYQFGFDLPSYEDSQYNRIMAASTAISALKSVTDPKAREWVAEARKTAALDKEQKDKVKLVLNSSGESYQCTKGSTRPFTLEQFEMQAKYNARFTCTFYSCTGKDPAEKVLMMMPKTGSTHASPYAMVMKNGQAKLFEGDFKVYDSSPLVLASIPKKQNPDEDPRLPEADVKADLLIPSKYNQSKSSYQYLMERAQRDFAESDEKMDLCKDDTKIMELAKEQKKIAKEMQKHLAEAEIIEYLKIIDGTIQSFYVDRKKAQSLGCLYQDKIVDSSVMEQFDHLKKISTLKSTGKFLKPNEVQELFKKAKNMKDIPFGYKYDGCYARAHIMSKRFEAMGIPTQKAWIKGGLFMPGTDIEWNYHVAPTVEVKEKNGKIVNYVIDPSVTDKAVPLDEWVAAIGKKGTGPIMKTTYPFPSNVLDFQRTSVAISPSGVYGPVDIQSMSEEDKMNLSTSRLKELSEVLASQGTK